MIVQQDALKMEPVEQGEYINVGKPELGDKSLRPRVLAGGIICAGSAVALICLVLYLTLPAGSGSAAETMRAVLVAGLTAFAILAVLVVASSNRVSNAFEKSGSGIGLGPSEEPPQTSDGGTDDSFIQSESRRKEAETARAYALLVSAIDGLPQSVFCKDLDGTYTFANKAYCAMLRLEVNQIVGKADVDLFPPDFAERCIRDDKKALETGLPVESVIERSSSRRRESFTQVTILPRRNERGEIAGTQGILWDVTESKLAEQALAQERDLLAAIMNTTTDKIYFKDLESRIIRTNKANATLLGMRDPSETIGKTDADFFTEEHANQAREDEERIIKTGKSMVGVEERETWPDREDTWVSTTKHPLHDSEGRIIGTFGITRDITDRKRAEESLQRALSEFLSIVSRVSEGDLTLRAEEGDNTLGMVARSVNKMLDSFGQMLTKVKGLGLSVSSSASQILVAAEQIETGTERQTEETTSVTSSVQEMAASMSQVSNNAEGSVSAARRALTTAEDGSRSVHQTSEAMTRINSAVEETAQKMRLLAQRSSEIPEILSLINEVASQTNLLSLNAAIEAAHAGEAGLGFSVVAEEIRKLADRTASATRDVSSLVKRIQSETAAALSAMDRGMAEVKTGGVLAQKSRQALEDISAAVKQSVDLIEEISAASEGQALVTGDLASAMQTISSITVEASAGAHETSRIIQGMVGLSEELNRSISRFKVTEDSTFSCL